MIPGENSSVRVGRIGNRYTGLVLGLLTGQPGAPRGDPTGAVVLRACDADERPEPVAFGVHLDSGGAAERLRVVSEGGFSRYPVRLQPAVLVVSDQDGSTGSSGEDGHPVRIACVWIAVVVDGDPRLSHHLVREPFGQRQD